MQAGNEERYKIEQMRRFYEIFPYPDRAFFVTPLITYNISVHGAFSKLMSENQTLAAQAIFTKALKKFYGKNFKNKGMLKDLEKIFPNNKKILLVGCGTDEPLLFRMLHPENDLVCIDLSKQNIKIAKRKLYFHSLFSVLKFFYYKRPKTEFIVGDANIILKQNYIGKFDYIQCFGVLHHQPKPEILLEGMAERLVDGGTLRIMVYSYYGRSLERIIQKRYNYIWNNISKMKKLKLLLRYNFFLLKIWQIFNFIGLKKSTYLRFKYLGFNSNFIADAFMHPSDPGLPLEDILPMANKYNLRLIYCQAKIENEGDIYGFQNPLETWCKIMNADKHRTLLNNPTLIFVKALQ